MQKKIIHEEIVILKAIAITGVIIQHMHPPLINHALTLSLKHIFSRFHMEAFMFASGFLFGISRVDFSSFSEYCAFIIRKFRRLMVPYFVLSGIVLVLKYSAQQFVTLLSPIRHDFWIKLIFNPVDGFAAFLWFLYILFFVFLIFPILHKIFRSPVVLLLVLFAINAIPIPESVFFNHYLLRWGLLFFCLGYVFSSIRHERMSVFSIFLCILMFVLVAFLTKQTALVADYLQDLIGNSMAEYMFRLIIAVFGTFAFYYLSVVAMKYKNPLTLMMKYIGTYAGSIYLLHTISMAGVRILLIDMIGLKVSLFPLISILIFVSGFVFPILIARKIIKKFDVLPPLILGVRNPL